jgi:hypothetical protein
MGAILLNLSRNPTVYVILGSLLAVYALVSALGVSPNFDQRAIGISVLHGQDASLRTLLHVVLVLSATSLLLSLFLKLNLGSVAPHESPSSPRHAVILASLLVMSLLLYVLRDKAVFLYVAFAVLYLMALGFVIAARDRVSRLGDLRWILVVLVYQALLTAYAVCGEQPRFDATFFSLLSVLLLVVLGICEVTSGGAGATAKKDTAGETAISSELRPFLRFAQAGWPLALLPLTIIFSNEIQYTLSVRFFLDVSTTTIWATLIGVLLSISTFSYVRIGDSSAYRLQGDALMLALRRLLVFRYLPATLVCAVAFAEYRDFVQFYAFHDLFHGGESLVPVQQLLQFGAIPYIDFYPPHGLFDMLPQLFYQLLNETSYPESILWGQGYILGWLPRMLTVLLMYWFFARFVDHRSVFVVLFFLPTYHLLHPYYALLVLPLVALNGNERGIGRWLFFWGLIFSLFLWRVDFGLVTTVAAAFMLLARFWSEPEWSRIRNCFVASVLVFGSAALLFVTLCSLRGQAPLEVIAQSLSYIRVQNQTAALANIVQGVDVAAAMQYVLLPLVGVTYVAYFSAGVLAGKKVTHLQGVVAFLAIVSLVLSSRSLNRHSHFEGVFNPYFFTLIVALVAVLYMRKSRTLQAVVFAAICAGSYAFFPKSTSLFHAFFYNSGVEKEIAGPASTRKRPVLNLASAPETRVDASFLKIDNIVFFLQSFLQGEETFYDFTNSPLLYAPSEKRVPVFILETLYHTSEPIQADVMRRLSSRIVAGELPVVLFKQGSLWDEVDGVPNEIRSYRIVEFIYRHFRPCANVDNYEVWLSRELFTGEECMRYLQERWPQYDEMPDATGPGLREIVRNGQQFELLQLPFIWANHDEDMSSIATSSGTAAVFTELPEGGYQLLVPPDLDKQQGNYIHLRILSANDGVAQLSYGDGNSFSFGVVGGDEPRNYLIRVSSQYAWHDLVAGFLQFSSAEPLTLMEASILPGD